MCVLLGSCLVVFSHLLFLICFHVSYTLYLFDRVFLQEVFTFAVSLLAIPRPPPIPPARSHSLAVYGIVVLLVFVFVFAFAGDFACVVVCVFSFSNAIIFYM